MDKKSFKRMIDREVLKELYRNGNRFKLKFNVKSFIITLSTVDTVMSRDFSNIKYELKGFNFNSARDIFTFDMKIRTPIRRLNYEAFKTINMF